MNGKKESATFTITNMTHGRLPRLPFSDIKNAILGKRYVLSVVCMGDALSRALNRRYRKKNKPANVLSFPLEPHAGEILINLRQARRELRAYKRTYKNHIGRLFIHGLFHLKGHRHHSTMEKEEARIQKKFSLFV